ncbi:MAG TPA: type III PLP-dependent enzyme [Ilumatobacter sp.]|nr:type III PLP-dependent enzyme [Ilumatobacter sp.]
MNTALTPITPKLERFLASTSLPTPFVVFDVDVVEQRYRALRDALPAANVYYAVKANPGRPILERLHALGSSFDVASPAEIEACLAVGVPPSRISYGNTIKKRADISTAAALGVRRFTVDCVEELAKVVELAPGSSVCVRLFHDCGGADWPLSRKFGCAPSDVVRLLVAASSAGLACGVSFHVGSQQRDVHSWFETLGVVADVFAQARELGAAPSFLNLGGGFPGTYRDAVPDIGDYGTAVTAALGHWFPEALRPDSPIEVMVEPGRYLVADAGVLRSEVVLVSTRTVDDFERWVYLDVGKFHGLAETMDEAIRYRLRTSRDGGPTSPVVIAGPTCDSADVLYSKSGYELPVTLRDGDLVDLLSAGAYTTTYSSVGFNGFAPLAEHFI